VSNLDALYGSYGSGGLSAMILPHHISPLLHAAHENADTDTEVDAAVDADAQVDSEQAKQLRARRDQSLHYFNISNLYVKNWLQYSRNQTDLVCDDFGVQVAKIARSGILNDAVVDSSKLGSDALDAAGDSRSEVLESSVGSSLAHGDVLVTKHAHVLNAQLCFHVNVQPRRGGGGGGELSQAPSGGIRMNEEEIKQQVSERNDN
jgi:hypothetical protein